MLSFAEKVYAALERIPRGRVTTYALLARAVGAPLAARAVGNALNKNPDLIIVPCHRVVKSDGGLGGYAKGVAAKARLLRDEGVSVEHEKVDLTRYVYKFSV